MTIRLKKDGVFISSDTERIEYAYVEKGEDWIWLVLEGGEKLKYNSSLTTFIKLYGTGEGLMLAHRKYIIHIGKVKGIIKYCVIEMNSGKVIDLGREAYDIVKEYLEKKLNGNRGEGNVAHPETT